MEMTDDDNAVPSTLVQPSQQTRVLSPSNSEVRSAQKTLAIVLSSGGEEQEKSVISPADNKNKSGATGLLQQESRVPIHKNPEWHNPAAIDEEAYVQFRRMKKVKLERERRVVLKELFDDLSYWTALGQEVQPQRLRKRPYHDKISNAKECIQKLESSLACKADTY